MENLDIDKTPANNTRSSDITDLVFGVIFQLFGAHLSVLKHVKVIKDSRYFL